MCCGKSEERIRIIELLGTSILLMLFGIFLGSIPFQYDQTTAVFGPNATLVTVPCPANMFNACYNVTVPILYHVKNTSYLPKYSVTFDRLYWAQEYADIYNTSHNQTIYYSIANPEEWCLESCGLARIWFSVSVGAIIVCMSACVCYMIRWDILVKECKKDLTEKRIKKEAEKQRKEAEEQRKEAEERRKEATKAETLAEAKKQRKEATKAETLAEAKKQRKEAEVEVEINNIQFDIEKQETCGLLCKICESRSVIKILDCGHTGCHTCLEQIKITTGVCPYCRAPITRLNPVFLN